MAREPLSFFESAIERGPVTSVDSAAVFISSISFLILITLCYVSYFLVEWLVML